MERVKPLRYTFPPVTPPAPVHREERPLLGIGFNALSFVAIACADALSKLAVAVMPAPQIILLRAIMILALLTPMFWQAARQNDPPWRTQQWGLHLLRSALQILAMVTFLIAVRNMPLTTVVSIQFISPLLVAIFAALLLKEKLSWAQVGPILLGFAGCMIILQPGTEGFSYFSIIAIICAVSWSLVLVLLRGLTAADSAATILFWQNAMQVVAMIFVAPFLWVAVTTRHAVDFNGAGAHAIAWPVAIHKGHELCPCGCYRAAALHTADLDHAVGLARIPGMARSACVVWCGHHYSQRLVADARAKRHHSLITAPRHSSKYPPWLHIHARAPVPAVSAHCHQPN